MEILLVFFGKEFGIRNVIKDYIVLKFVIV